MCLDRAKAPLKSSRPSVVLIVIAVQLYQRVLSGYRFPSPDKPVRKSQQAY
jgi:hypothetical protein